MSDDSHEIFGYCDLPIEKGTPTESNPPNLKRLILKTDEYTAKNLQVKLKRSLVRKCANITIRTDMQTMGIYFMKHWLLKFMCDYEERENAIEFTNFGNEFVSFIAKNQFKQAIRSHAVNLNGNSKQIAEIMNPL